MFNDSGPLWTGNLWDYKLADKMYKQLLKKTMNNKKNDNGLLRFLKIIKGESKINIVGFYDIHKIAKNKKLRTIIKKDILIKKIKTELNNETVDKEIITRV